MKQLYIAFVYIFSYSLYSVNSSFFKMPIVYEYTHKQPLKDWSFIVYMAADNTLRLHALPNIYQMAQQSSNNKVNIFIHLDLHLPGEKKITKRLYIEKDRLIQVAPDTVMDSGDPATLIDFFKEAHGRYPARRWAVILWDHGSGYLDNPALLRSNSRAICLDETYNDFLTNTKLVEAFSAIQQIIKRKLDIIGCDACFMQMCEVALLVAPYAKFLVASQHTEPARGWNYYEVLRIFEHSSPTSYVLAQHMVKAYKATYQSISKEYTQSAVNLEYIELLHANITTLAQLLTAGLKQQKNHSLTTIIRKSRSKLYCTYFAEPSYIDLFHFYSNLAVHIQDCVLTTPQKTDYFKKQVRVLVGQGCKLIKKMVIAHCASTLFEQARGISIYFPLNKIFYLYTQIPYPSIIAWSKFIEYYLKAQNKAQHSIYSLINSKSNT